MKPVTRNMIIGGVIIAVAAAIIVMTVHGRKSANSKPDQAGLASPATQFTWRYADGGNDLDGLPKTKIVLDVTYQNGKVISQSVDEVQGSCNDVDLSVDDKDIVAGTTKIQCYAAGFGEWYKIVHTNDSYQIMRKYFQEGIPEEIPKDYSWEMVAGLPLFQ